LPEPERPMTTTSSPDRISQETPASARMVRPSSAYSCSTFRQVISMGLGPGAAGQQPLKFEIKPIGSRPAAELKADSRMLQVVKAVDAQLGNSSRMQRASTDANVPMSMGLEALTIGAGGQGGGAHTLHEWYDPTNRDLGFKRIVMTMMTLAGGAE